MAMLDIEYRYVKDRVPGGDFPGREIRRDSVKKMEEYLRGLVYEMQEADINARYIGKETEDENQVYINGMKVNDILRGLEIKMLDPEEDTCGCGGARPMRTTYFPKTFSPRSWTIFPLSMPSLAVRTCGTPSLP